VWSRSTTETPTRCGRGFLEAQFKEENIKCIKTAKVLKQGLASAIGHKQDGSHAQTQMVVISQDGFVDLMIDSISSCCHDDRLDVLVFECRTGHHRSDTSCRMFESIANAIEKEPEVRAFNAIAYNLSSSFAYGDKDLAESIKSIVLWLEKPWMNKPSGMTKTSCKYDYEACSLHPIAWANFNTIWDHFMRESHKGKKRKRSSEAETRPSPPAGSPPSPRNPPAAVGEFRPQQPKTPSPEHLRGSDSDQQQQ